jgi:hypothetical protein
MLIKNPLSESDRNDISNFWNNTPHKVLDHQASNVYAIRQAPFLDKYHTKVKKVLQTETGFSFSELFTLIREYKKGDSLRKHIDNAAPCCISIIIKQSDTKDNPLVLYQEEPTTFLLQEGDGCFFWGMTVPHERLEVQSDSLLQVYFGYDVRTKTSII